uniref:Cytochrome b-c1 complex subunit 10 n=1 Tax=Peromyscus maniculatus bairdii TaxID=230844 RepID=A0A8C8TIX6_PERMB
MLGKFLGPRYWELAKNWVPTASMWDAVGAVGLVWATDWRLILDWVPYINELSQDDFTYISTVFKNITGKP